MHSHRPNHPDPGLAGFFFTTVLENLGCRQINIAAQEMDAGEELICGFNNAHPHILDMVSFLFPCDHVHNIEDHYIVRLKKSVAEKQWEFYFKKAFNVICDVYPGLRAMGDYNNNSALSNKYSFILEERSYPRIIRNDPLKNTLAEMGLGLRTERTVSLDFSSCRPLFHPSIERGHLQYFTLSQMPTLTWDEKKIIAVDDYRKFVKTYVFPSIQKETLKKIKKEWIGNFFASNFVSNKNRKIMGYFDHTAFKCPPAVGRQANPESHWIAALENRILALENEIDSCFCYNKQLKIQKIKFLDLVLSFKKLNPLFSFKRCIEFAKNDAPLLYQEAVRGQYRTLTRDLLHAIMSGPDQTLEGPSHLLAP